MRVGAVVVQREIQDGFVWSAIPVRVAATGSTVGLFRRAGTICWWPSHPRGTARPFDEVTQRGVRWNDNDWSGVLTLVEPGADYSVSVIWNGDWSLWGWYVDFIRPYRRSAVGWDFTDLHLDLIVHADGRVVRKDEDELTVAVERGELSPSEAARLRRRCDELQSHAAPGVGPFEERWRDWRPDPGWTTPTLTQAAGEKLAASPTPADFRPELTWWIDQEPTAH